MNEDKFAELYRPMFDEDPHLRHRTVPMKVLVLGYPRTGTSSIQKALEQLGYGPCYHMRTAMNEYPRDCKMWKEAYDAKYNGKGKVFGREEWDQLLGRYSSVCDVPAVGFAPDLMHAYPSAKIILTNRDVDSWHQSISHKLLRSRFYRLHGILQYIDWATALVHPLRIKFWQCLFDDDFEKNGRGAMMRHYEEVRGCAKADGRKVLEMHLGDGWEELCGFLGVDLPESPYPNLYNGDAFILVMKERARLRMRAVAKTWLRAGSIVAILWFGMRLVRHGSRLTWWMPDRNG